MFLYNKLFKKPPAESGGTEKKVMERTIMILGKERERKFDKIEQLNPVLNEEMTSLLSEPLDTVTEKDKPQILNLLYHDSINSDPPTLFLSDIKLPETCTDLKSFESFLLDQEGVQGLNQRLNEYRNFNNLYTDAYRALTHEFKFNGEVPPTDCAPNGDDDPQVRVQRKKKFEEFITTQMGAQKQNFIKNYNQHLYSMANNIISKALFKQRKSAANPGISINFIPESKGVATHTKIVPKYRHLDDDDGTLHTMPGTLSTKTMLSDSGEITFSDISTSSVEIAGLLLNVDTEAFLKHCSKLIAACDHNAAHSKNTSTTFLLIKENIIKAQAEFDVAAINKYDSILKRLARPEYRAAYNTLRQQYKKLYDDATAVLRKGEDRLRTFTKAEGEHFEQVLLINQKCVTLLGILDKLNFFPDDLKDFNNSLKDCSRKLETIRQQLLLDEAGFEKKGDTTAPGPSIVLRRKSSSS